MVKMLKSVDIFTRVYNKKKANSFSKKGGRAEGGSKIKRRKSLKMLDFSA